MKIQISTPMLASGEFVMLPCVTEVPATDGRRVAVRGAAWGSNGSLAGADARRTRIAGTHAGFAHSTGSLTWSPPI